ncbi:S8 family serine peptidase [Cochleicola gelatinilyticus]|uniref:Serine protease n=1 Tax=Cochleicola gelatinilyticus TaxID=1763537 RepID=A0A167K8S4_9FLAO|nr:S8 family serine peptidase [Cochleicola gelatinilyticus]OAB81507.1 serine protease [Cochleicola gelatinilyticus]
MKKILIICVLIVSQWSFGQEEALVFLADKENVAASLENPITILTQDAIDRKTLHSTPIDERDVPVNENYIAQLKSTSGIEVLAKSKWMNAVYVVGSETNINNLLNLDFVTEIEFSDSSLNFFRTTRSLEDKFNFEGEQSSIIYDYGAALNQVEMLSVDYLHEQDYTGENITVAVMDSGFPNVNTNPAYQEMRDEGRLLGTYDFVRRIENGDGFGSHGARTFSDMGGFLDGQFVGTAPKASYYLYVTEDARPDRESPVEEAYWVEALERADSLGVYVTNTSLGYQDFVNPSYDHSYEDLDGQTTIAARGANLAFDKGMLNVTSAGNDGNPGNFLYVATPADAPGVLTVGSVNSEEIKSGFSSIGPTVDGRIKPDVMAQGSSAAVVSENGQVETNSGTSFSSPIMAGAVASLWQASPELTNMQIMQIVRESADRFSNPNDEYGYGIPNFEDAVNAAILLGVQEQQLKDQFAIYPNPVTTTLNVVFPKNSRRAQVVLYNVLGKKILETEISSVSRGLDVSHLSSGVYIAKITSENKSNSFKIIKQ